MRYTDNPLTLDIHTFAQAVHENARTKGWHEKRRPFLEIAALIHSEVSEAVEEVRNGHAPDELYYVDGKPEGVPSELADIIIRVLDYCEAEHIDIEHALLVKHEYNLTRPYKHGGKTA